MNVKGILLFSFSGMLHACQKSQLASVLEANVVPNDKEPVVTALIKDGSAFVNANPPRSLNTFGEYA